RPEDTALGVRAVRVAERGDVDAAAVGRVDTDPRDGLGVGQADVGPGLPSVGRLVHAVALDGVGPQIDLAGPGVHHVRIGRAYGDGTNGRTRQEPIGHRIPAISTVRGLPHTPAGGAEVILVRAGDTAAHRDRTP